LSKKVVDPCQQDLMTGDPFKKAFESREAGRVEN
jgi:hypothetical protein